MVLSLAAQTFSVGLSRDVSRHRLGTAQMAVKPTDMQSHWMRKKLINLGARTVFIYFNLSIFIYLEEIV